MTTAAITTTPPFDFASFVADKTRDFTGREWAFAQVAQWLTTSTPARVPGLLYISGAPMSGKSALAARMYQFSQGAVQPPREPTPDIANAMRPGFLAAVHFCNPVDPATLDAHLFTQSIALQLADWQPQYRAIVKNEESEELEPSISRLLSSGVTAREMFDRLVATPLARLLSTDVNISLPVVLVDGVDADLTGTADTITSFTSELVSGQTAGPNAMVIATGRPPVPSWGVQPYIVPLDGTGPEGVEDVRRYLQRLLRQDPTLRQRLSSKGPEADVLGTVATSADGNFVEAARLLAEYAATGQLEPDSAASASEISPTDQSPGTVQDGPATAEPGPAEVSAPIRYGPEPTLLRDYWTEEDRLGHDAYANAIAEFIRHPQTVPPLTIGITAAWGAGKTSLMRMVRERLDPKDSTGKRASLSLMDRSREQLTHEKHARRPTVRTVFKRTNDTRQLQDRDLRQMQVQPEVDNHDETQCRPTVWFNPWMYQSVEQVWAGLAYEIISTLTERLPEVEREHFWLALNMRRLDRAAVRRRIYRLVLENVLPIAAVVMVAVLLLAGVSLAGFLENTASLTSGAVILGFLASAVQTLRVFRESAAATVPGLVKAPDYTAAWRSLVGEQPVVATNGILRDPDYETRLGFLHVVQADMKAVLNLFATERRPVVVFVDDVDRCSSAAVAQIIEAINLFVAGDFPNCIFILALEPAVVAAHIEVAYKDLVARLQLSRDPGEESSLGWRFLSKIVQLPLRLPTRSSDENLKTYLDSLLGEPHTPGTVPPRTRSDLQNAQQEVLPSDTGRVAVSEEQQESIAGAIHAQAPGLEDIGASAARAQQAVLGTAPSVPLQSETRVAARAVVADILREDNPQVRAVVDSSIDDLASRNPREIKRFVNLLRFYGTISAERQLANLPAADLRQVAKAAILALRWPHLMDGLCRPARQAHASWLSELEENAADELAQIETSEAQVAEAIAKWGTLVRLAGLTNGTAREPTNGEVPLSELRAFLRKGARIGSSAGLL